MKEVYIIVEGQTEEEFVNSSLSNYLNAFDINVVVPILMETSPGHFGGSVTYSRYKSNIIPLLKYGDHIVVTSIIDFYQLYSSFPKYNESLAIPDKVERVKFLEDSISIDINNPRFIPYIQLHEFEGLLFSDIKGFDYIPNIPKANYELIKQTIDQYPNPELINDSAATCPSARLISLIPFYKKTFHGPIIAIENGMQSVLDRCPRFKTWIDQIILAASTI